MSDLVIEGRVKQGLRIASGLNPDPTLKLNNTIHLQRPHFLNAGVPGVNEWFSGTINIDIAPRQFKILKPDHEVTCEWVPGTTETFRFVAVEIGHKGNTYGGFIYYPCPSPVKSHTDDTIELLAPKIGGLEYGDHIAIHAPSGKIVITEI